MEFCRRAGRRWQGHLGAPDLSTSMYVNPMSIYREYIQNAADAIDQAREVGLLPKVGQGRVDLFIDVPTRTVRIRDDGGD